MAIVDDLLAHPGLYLGTISDPAESEVSAARMVVTPLPGGAGVSLDYETFNPAKPDRLRAHVEHTILARTHAGGTLLVCGHSHADSIAVLQETQPGEFVLGDLGSPFPMKILMSTPAPGRLLHSWWYGRPGEEPIERDSADLTLAS